MKKILIPLLIASLPLAVSAIEWETFDKYGNQIFQKDTDFPMNHIDDILTSEEVQVFAAISSRVILSKSEIQGYANDIDISVEAANDFYLAFKMMQDKANIESQKSQTDFCDKLSDTAFSDKTTKADLATLNKQASIANAMFYSVIGQELQALKNQYPKEYQKILDTHGGNFSIGYTELDFDNVTAENWVEHYNGLCNIVGSAK